MLRAVATAAIGLGMTLASTFAGSLGLSVHEERWLFAVGVFMLVVGVAWLVYDLTVGYRAHRDAPEIASPHTSTIRGGGLHGDALLENRLNRRSRHRWH